MKAIILAGGLGKRLKPLTDTIPKSMVSIGEKPILLWQIEWLKRYGVDEFVVCIGYLREKVMDFFGDGSRFGAPVRYVIEEKPLGTGGALRNASPHFPKSEPFFALNGDVVTDLDLGAVLAKHRQAKALGTLALVPLPSPYGIVVTDGADRITSFVEKPRLTDKWINGGVYCFEPDVVRYLPEVGSVELDVFPVLAREGRLTASKHADGFWMSVDSPKDIEAAAKWLAGRD